MRPSRSSSERPTGKPIVALDIDGTLAEYHEWFLRFAEMYLGRPLQSYWAMEYPSSEWPKTMGVPHTPTAQDHFCGEGGCQGSLWRHGHMSRTMYRQVKLAYRQGGLKRSMPAFPNASGLTRAVRKAGAEVWIATTRPYLRLDNIDPDTRHWLRRNRIQFDGVLYGENKYRQLVKIVGKERVVGVLDDLPEMLAQASQLDLPIVRIQRPHNAWHEVPWYCSDVPNLFEAEELLVESVRKYNGNS